VAYPATGAVAAAGANQWDWALYAQKRWNKSHKLKIRLIPGDTQLDTNAAQNIAVAHSFASNGKILAVTGPAGSQENQDAVPIYAAAGLATVSGSATRIYLTRAKLDDLHGTFTGRETPKGFFFRTVPNDGQQGDAVAAFINTKLKAKHVYIIDDGTSYSSGLADQVQADLKKDGLKPGRNHTTTAIVDYSSLITSIPANTQVVYIPWQVAGNAQAFYQQSHAAGKKYKIVGSDGTDVPGTFEPKGVGYVSGFPVDFTSSVLKAFTKAHNGQPETFGLPTYTAVWVNATAIQMACKAGRGKTTRAAVRKHIPKVKLTAKQSLLGFAVQFLSKNKGNYQGPGDMGGAANFAIFQINQAGTYVRVS
jgi:branched-chain amino acid transport system substrate-binding protein